MDDTLSEAGLIPCEHKIPTSPFEYAQALRQILATNKNLTIADLAAKIDRTPEWVEEQLKVTEERKLMEIFWDNKHGRVGLYELRAHPAAMILKLRKMSGTAPQGGGWLVNCLGEAAQFPGDTTDEQAKAAAISWMLPILDRLKDSLNALHSA